MRIRIRNTDVYNHFFNKERLKKFSIYKKYVDADYERVIISIVLLSDVNLSVWVSLPTTMYQHLKICL
jgi:hypothetical protein